MELEKEWLCEKKKFAWIREGWAFKGALGYQVVCRHVKKGNGQLN